MKERRIVEPTGAMPMNCPVFVDPVLLLRRDKDRAQIVARQHGLQVSILRPDAVHAMFQSK